MPCLISQVEEVKLQEMVQYVYVLHTRWISWRCSRCLACPHVVRREQVQRPRPVRQGALGGAMPVPCCPGVGASDESRHRPGHGHGGVGRRRRLHAAAVQHDSWSVIRGGVNDDGALRWAAIERLPTYNRRTACALPSCTRPRRPMSLPPPPTGTTTSPASSSRTWT